MDDATRAIAAGLRPGTLVSYETTLPVGTTRNRWAPMLEEGSGLTAGQGLLPGLQPRAGADRPGLRRPAQLPEAGRRHRRGVGRARRARSTRRCSTSTSAPTCRSPTASGTWARPRRRSWPSSPRPPTATSTSAWPTSSPGSPTRSGIDVTKVIEACNTQPYSHIHQPGIAVGGHCIPIYPRMYLWNDPAATVVRVRPRGERRRCREYAVDLLADAYGDLTGAEVLVLGAAYRGGVKETAFSGRLPDRRGAAGPGRPAVRRPTRCTPPRSCAAHGPAAARRASRSTAAVVQADHAEYRDAGGRPTCPGVRVLVDGRRVTDPARWAGVRRVVIGG